LDTRASQASVVDAHVWSTRHAHPSVPGVHVAQRPFEQTASPLQVRLPKQLDPTSPTVETHAPARHARSTPWQALESSQRQSREPGTHSPRGAQRLSPLHVSMPSHVAFG
jgi:hypothetical protein